jgi:uncharacterized repeat protein (TIGR01451 family)
MVSRLKVLFFALLLASGLSGAVLAAARSAAPATGPDVQVEKSLYTSHFYAGMLTAYRLVWTNEGDETASGLVLTDTLPAGATLLNIYGYMETPAGSTSIPEALIDGQTITWAIGEMGPGWVGFIELRVQIDPSLAAGAALTNRWQASISPGETDLQDNLFELVNVIEPPIPDLAVSKTLETPGVLDPGYSALYRLTWSNLGTSVARNVILTDTLPAYLTYLNSWGESSPGAPLPPAPLQSANRLTWRLHDLEPGWSGVIYVRVMVDENAPAGALQVNRFEASLSAGEVISQNNQVELSQNVLPRHPELKIGKWSGYPGLFQGVVGKYEITFENIGSGAAIGAWLTDTLPLSVTFLSASGVVVTPDSSITLPAPLVDGQRLTWQLSDLPPQSSGQIQLDVLVDPDLPAGSSLSNQAQISRFPNERDWKDNQASANNLVGADATDLTIHQYVSSQTAFPGSLVRHEINFQNRGSQTAPGAVLTNSLSDDLTLVECWGYKGNYHDETPLQPLPPPQVEGSLLTWQLGDLPSADFGYITFFAQISPQAPPGTLLTSRAGLAPAPGEINLSNNAFTAQFAVLGGNRAPVAADQKLAVLEDTPLRISLSASDPDGNLLYFTPWSAPPENGTLYWLANGVYTYTPKTNFAGTDHFQFRASDNYGAYDLGLVEIEVLPVDDPPQILDFALTVRQNEPVDLIQAGLLARYIDPDGPALLSIRLESLPAHGTLLVDNKPALPGVELPLAKLASLVYLPKAGYSGPDAFAWSGYNGQQRSGPVQVSLYLLGVPFQVYLPAVR